jgi:hypothetical protein
MIVQVKWLARILANVLIHVQGVMCVERMLSVKQYCIDHAVRALAVMLEILKRNAYLNLIVKR